MCDDRCTYQRACTPNPIHHCVEDNECNFLHTIRNGFQRIFTGKKRSSSPCRESVLRLSISQLRCIEQVLCTLDNEVHDLEETIRKASIGKCIINCSETRCCLDNITKRIEDIKRNLLCALELYEPSTDCCEYNLTCTLLGLIENLKCLIKDLNADIDCLEYQTNNCGPCNDSPCCKPCQHSAKWGAYKSNFKKDIYTSHYKPQNGPFNASYTNYNSDANRKKACCGEMEALCCRPCCVKEVGCRKPCCNKQRRTHNCVDGDVSTVPLGVLLMKL